MEYLVSSQMMKQADTYTINQIGMPSLVLMERAALAIVAQLYQQHCDLRRVAIVAGYGNNGGDGVAIARLLQQRGITVTLFMVGDIRRLTPETQQQLLIAQAYNVALATASDADFSAYSTIIDALFGVGLSREITAPFAVVIDKINASQAYIVAVDIPSGISADNGQIMGVAIKAHLTITLAYKKIGLLLYPGAAHTGHIEVADIGIDEVSFAGQRPMCYSLQKDELVDLLPHRPDYSNKGSFGKVLVIAGSTTMSGAAYFSAKAAYRTGAGLVRIYTPESNRAILLSQLPEALLSCYQPEQIAFAELKAALNWATVIVFGPGMSTHSPTLTLLTTVLAQANCPLIIDADGLNVLADNNLALLKTASHPIIITPHLGEMARLTKQPLSNISHHLLDVACQFAQRHQVICALKDARTVVAQPDGHCYINQYGNNGMATGGSGDVLTGIIAGLIAQGMPPEQAAPVSVYLHSLAGDVAANRDNRYSVMAEDIISGLVALLSQANPPA